METPEQLACESGKPAHRGGPLPSVLVRCGCGTIHYAAPSDTDPTGRKCLRCAFKSMPTECQCGQADCRACGPVRIPKSNRNNRRLRVRSW